jgi:hypothetical protein
MGTLTSVPTLATNTSSSQLATETMVIDVPREPGPLDSPSGHDLTQAILLCLSTPIYPGY